MPVYHGGSKRPLARRSRVINIRCVLRRRSLERGKSALLLSPIFLLLFVALPLCTMDDLPSFRKASVKPATKGDGPFCE